MKKIIQLEKKYEFVFLDQNEIKIDHPVSDYFFKLNDLSINLIISLKWILWGYFFLNSISKEIKNPTYNYESEKILTKIIQKNYNLGEEVEHLLLIDNEEIKSFEKLEERIKNFYNNAIFDENTRIHLKLKLNLREYLILNHLLFPTLLEFGEKVELKK